MFSTASTIEKDGHTYPLFLLAARRPGPEEGVETSTG
jgi:hypothetical protein